MNELTTKENIEKKIYEIRGKEVMLDSDLANLYQCKNGTKTINLAVKRNIARFPNDFYFQLTSDEYDIICGFKLKPQLLINMTRYLPYVFTEQGVAMLATVIHTEIASSISIQIMRAFVLMRHYLSENIIEQKLIANQVGKNTEDIKLLQESFSKLEEKVKINHLFFEGQIYDSYSLLIDILNKSNEEIIIIDNYAGKELLDILKGIDKKIKIYSKNMDDILIKKYQKEYSNVKFIYNDSFHDRFLILDQRKLYHFGASFKELGKKCFAINKIDDDEILNKIIGGLK